MARELVRTGQAHPLDLNVDMPTLVDMFSAEQVFFLRAGEMRDYGQAIPRDWQAMSRVFSALGDEHRQRILLLFEPGERLNVGQIAEVSTLARSTVSHHLKTLRDADVLHSEKVGKEVYFWINKAYFQECLGKVLDYLRESA